MSFQSHQQNLSKRPDFKELASKGGKVCNDKKKKAAMIRGTKRTTCKKCLIECEFKKMCLQKDPKSLCIVPHLLAAAKQDGTRLVSLDDNKVKMYMDELMKLYKEYCIDAPSYETEPKKVERERMRRLNTMFHRLKEFKELWSPPVQKSVNVNIITNFDKMIERIKDYKEKEEPIMVIKKDE